MIQIAGGGWNVFFFLNKSLLAHFSFINVKEKRLRHARRDFSQTQSPHSHYILHLWISMTFTNRTESWVIPMLFSLFLSAIPDPLDELFLSLAHCA